MAPASRLTTAQQAVAAAVADAQPAPPLVVALSGGADSAALAWAVSQLGVPARAISVDHGLPGSAGLMEAARRIAAVLAMVHTIVPASSRDDSETALREARLAALEAAAAPDETIITGHTADDQAETVLGNLVRGAGTTGLSGIPARRGRFVRPLLAVPRDVTRRAAADAGLPFADDPVNADPAVWRNRIRTVTIPHLAEEYNPAVRSALARTGALLAADDHVLERRAAAIPVRHDEEAVLIPAAALTALPGPVAARVVRRALRLLFDPYPGSADDVAAVMHAAASGVTASLGGGLTAAREGALVAIHPSTPVPAPEPVPLAATRPTRFGPWTIEPEGGRVGIGRRRAVVPLGERSLVRAPVPGDRVAIVGGGHKKVSDVLGEARVPVRLRSRWPLVVTDDTVVWVVGARVGAVEGRRTPLRATREVR
jgi:tRNA(Ile)-lysidine synthase